MADGTVHTREVSVPIGSPGMPLTDAELEAKWQDAAPDKNNLEKVLATIRVLEKSSLNDLMALL